MTIQLTQTQIEAFDQIAQQRVLNDMCAHIKTFFPSHYADLAPDNHLRFCKDVVKKAASFGYETERNIFMFLNIMIMLGEDFDTKPEFQWARDILTDPIPEPEYNIEALADAALKWTQQRAKG
ncbi:hypothetical protein PN836_014955 [Ningiella sp. W23]|uniref:hypothetical protein n=1 Tax=Ningiella sp. W23 TaxID=3023715 RepID=UPI0037579BFC